jgi:hypothetical protein
MQPVGPQRLNARGPADEFLNAIPHCFVVIGVPGRGRIQNSGGSRVVASHAKVTISRAEYLFVATRIPMKPSS